MSDDKIDLVVAASEFERFADAMGLVFDVSGFNPEEKQDFEKARNMLIQNIVAGHLVIDSEGEAEYTPRRTSGAQAIHFYEATGAALKAMDRRGKSEDIGKFFATLGEITKQPPAVFSKLKMADLNVCMSVAILFLAQ